VDGSVTEAEHQRYAWAADCLAGLRVLELNCGAGEGTEVLAAKAASVRAVDPDPAAVRLAARRTAGAAAVDVADAECALRAAAGGIDAIVDLASAGARPPAALLAQHAQAGVALVVLEPAGGLPGARRLSQYAAEGALLLAEDTDPDEAATVLLTPAGEAGEPVAVLLTANVDGVVPAGGLWHVSPAASRELERLRLETAELHSVNRRLSDQVAAVVAELGAGAPPISLFRRADTAATGHLAAMMEAAARSAELEERLERSEQRVLDLDARAKAAEARVEELEAALRAERAQVARFHALRRRKVVRVALGVASLRTLPAKLRGHD